MKKLSWVVLVLALLAMLVVPSVSTAQAKATTPTVQRVRGGVAEQGVPGHGAGLQEEQPAVQEREVRPSTSRAPTRWSRRSSRAPRPTCSPAPAPSTAHALQRRAHRDARASSARTGSLSSCRASNPAGISSLADIAGQGRLRRRRLHSRADRQVHERRARQHGRQRQVPGRLQDDRHGEGRRPASTSPRSSRSSCSAASTPGSCTTATRPTRAPRSSELTIPDTYQTTRCRPTRSPARRTPRCRSSRRGS